MPGAACPAAAWETWTSSPSPAATAAASARRGALRGAPFASGRRAAQAPARRYRYPIGDHETLPARARAALGPDPGGRELRRPALPGVELRAAGRHRRGGEPAGTTARGRAAREPTRRRRASRCRCRCRGTGSTAVDVHRRPARSTSTRAQMTMTVHDVDGGDESDAQDLEMRIVGRTAYVQLRRRLDERRARLDRTRRPRPDPDELPRLPAGRRPTTSASSGTSRCAASTDALRGDARPRAALARTSTIPAAAGDPARDRGARQPPDSRSGVGRRRRPPAQARDVDRSHARPRRSWARAERRRRRSTSSMELYDFGVPVDVRVPAGAVGRRRAAQDHAAQSDLRNALTAEKVHLHRHADVHERPGDAEADRAVARLGRQARPSSSGGTGGAGASGRVPLGALRRRGRRSPSPMSRPDRAPAPTTARRRARRSWTSRRSATSRPSW